MQDHNPGFFYANRRKMIKNLIGYEIKRVENLFEASSKSQIMFERSASRWDFASDFKNLMCSTPLTCGISHLFLSKLRSSTKRGAD
jgi:hypothetical protein